MILPASRTWQNHAILGIWMMIAGQLLHVVGGIFEKMLLGIYPLAQMTFIRTVLRLLPLCIVLLKQKEIKAILSIEQPFCHLLRLAAYVIYNCLMLYALSVTSLIKSCAMQYVTPFFTIILSAWILKEKIGMHKWLAISIASLGVLIAILPFGSFEVIFLVILFGSFVGSFNKILIRRLVATEHSLSITLYGNIAIALVLIPAILTHWNPVSWHDLSWFAIASFLTATGQYATVQSLRFAQASTLAPFDYTSIIWAGCFDFFIWGVIPTPYLILGTMIIICSNLWLLKSISQRQKESPSSTTSPTGGEA